MSQAAREHEELESLTPQQRAAVEAWKAAGCPERPEVAALRNRIRGEPLTPDEEAMLLAISRPVPPGAVPHSEVTRMLAERAQRGG